MAFGFPQICVNLIAYVSMMNGRMALVRGQIRSVCMAHLLAVSVSVLSPILSKEKINEAIAIYI